MNKIANELETKIKSHKANIAVAGLGYVGLPLALRFAEKGFKTFGLDVDKSKVELLQSGNSYIKTITSERVRRAVEGEFVPTSDFSVLTNCDVMLICVPTPLGKYREPDLSFVTNTTRQISPYIGTEKLVILESTSFPGTTDEIVKPILEESGHKEGEDIFIAFSPEREDPGNKNFSIGNIPKVVGGCSEVSGQLAVVLYGEIVKEIVPVSSAKAAEATKILENTYRSVNIALVNELKTVFTKMGIDIWEVIRAASTKPFGFQSFYPGPGLGGHCIPIDPFYLTWKAREYGLSTRFIELAGEVNISMPEYIVSRVAEALNGEKKTIKDSRIFVLGMAYKKDIDDMRESPSVEIIHLLLERGASVSYNDPFIPRIPKIRKYKMELESVELNEKILADSDCILILTDHSQYDYQWIADNAHLIVDTRNTVHKLAKTKARIVTA